MGVSVLMDWWQRLIFWLTAPPVQPPAEQLKSILPPWENPGRRLSPKEAGARHEPRPLPPWELERQRAMNLAQVPAEDEDL